MLHVDGISELPRAYIVRRTGGPEAQTPLLTAETVYHYSRTRLARYKALDGGVVFVDHIPRTASGKVQRFKLKALTPELSVVENMVVAHCNALADPEVLSKIEMASAQTLPNERKFATHSQTLVDALALTDERLAKRRCLCTGSKDDKGATLAT